MLLSTITLAAFGIVQYIIVALYFKWMLRENESGLLHVFLGIIFALWLPIPVVVFHSLQSPHFLLVGTVFGVAAIFLFMTTMVMQAGHLTYSAKQAALSKPEKWEERDNWILQGMLGGTFECFASVLEGIWIIFLTVAFWQAGCIIMGCIGIVFSLFIIPRWMSLIDGSTVRETPFLNKWRFHFLVNNLQTLIWYSVLTVWLITQL